MDASLQDEMSADFFSVWEEVRDSVTLDSQQYKALVSDGTLGAELELGGFENTRTLTVKLLRVDLPAVPAVGSILQYGGLNYRINSVNGKPTMPIVSFSCLQV